MTTDAPTAYLEKLGSEGVRTWLASDCPPGFRTRAREWLAERDQEAERVKAATVSQQTEAAALAAAAAERAATAAERQAEAAEKANTKANIAMAIAIASIVVSIAIAFATRFHSG